MTVLCFLNSVHSGGFAVAGLRSASVQVSMKENKESTAKSLNDVKAFLRWSSGFLFRGVCTPRSGCQSQFLAP